MLNNPSNINSIYIFALFLIDLKVCLTSIFNNKRSNFGKGQIRPRKLKPFFQDIKCFKLMKKHVQK